MTCCGTVASPNLNLTVYPFILRGFTLSGIDSQNYPMNYRKLVWSKLAENWKPVHILDTCNEITLDKIQENIELMLQGKLKVRTILNLDQ